MTGGIVTGGIMTGRAVAIVQARLTSTRLPEKILMPLAGRPVILHIVDRLRHVRGLDEVVIATTSAPEEDRLVECLASEGIAVFRYDGPTDDLLGRYLAAGHAYDADVVLMVCSDCPLFDPDTAGRMIARLRRDKSAEYVAIAPSTIEGGVACLRLSTYERMDRQGARGEFREHATLRIIKHPEEFRIVTIEADPAFVDSARSHRFWLDTPADYQFLAAVYNILSRPGEIIDLRKVLRLLDAHPELKTINADVPQNNPECVNPAVSLAKQSKSKSKSKQSKQSKQSRKAS